MTAMTFDTLKFMETLKESGFDERQAKGMSTAVFLHDIKFSLPSWLNQGYKSF